MFASLPFIVSIVISFVASYFAIKLAWKFKLIDDPKKSNHPKIIHSRPTPRGGVLAISLSVFISCLLFLPLDQHLIGILIGALVLVVMGLLDDRYNLNPYVRILIQIFAAGIPIAAGIGISFATNPFTGTVIDLSQPRIEFNLLGDIKSIWILADIFALIWIVCVMNFLNMGAKGVPGQLTGIIVVAALTISVISLKFSADITEWSILVLGLITAGSFLGFLPWHMDPQKIMPGFGGSNLGGYLLAILSILSTAKVGTLAVVLAIPLIDTGYVIVRRILAGKSPVWGDTRHLHHKLLNIGWTKTQVAIFYWLVTFILGILAVNLNAQNKLYTIVGVAILLGGFLLWITYRPNLKENN